MSEKKPLTVAEKNKRTLMYAFGFVAFMVGVAYASVPLYTLFCKVTGFGGTPKEVAANPGIVVDRTITVRFNADTAPNLPWSFRPDQKSVTVKAGEDALISYSAKNNASQPVGGTAIYNVTPTKAGKYFSKVECFCFGEQILPPGKQVHMPVSFYIDPAIAADPLLSDVKTITLSYTFFKKDTRELDVAMEKFYAADDQSAAN